MGQQSSKITQYSKVIREERDAEIERSRKTMESRRKQLKISAQKEEIITKSYAHELVNMLNKGEVTSREILTVLAYRASIIGSQLNLITEIDFEVADRQAQRCDDERKKSGKKNWTFKDEWNPETYLPPLFGVPTSVKDMFDQKGKRSTLGVTARAHYIKEKDCGAISCLRQGGIIPFVRSNVAQVTLTFETHNNLYGRSISPWNPDRNIGGSSGGQGAMLASFCTPLGIGSDIGGSLRIPAEFNGVTSLRPCFQRFPISRQYCTDFTDLHYGNDTIYSVYGPMARCVEDLSLWMKTMCDERYHIDEDPYHKLVEFNVEQYKNYTKKRLKIGYVKSYDALEATPASQRAVEEAVAALKKQGHEVVPVKIPHLDEVVDEFSRWYLAQGGFTSMTEILQGQDEIPSYKLTKLITKSRLFYCLASCLTGCGFLGPRLKATVDSFKPLTVADYLRHKSKVAELRMGFCSWWKSQNLDHIITPGFGCQSNLNELTGDIFAAVMYTSIWNTLNMPAGALPVTIVREDEQHYESVHNDLITRKLRMNARGSAGLPVGVMVIGMPYGEEGVLAVMRSIQRQVGFQKYRKVKKIGREES